MRVLFDTSVLVGALVENHPHHRESWPWLRAAARGELEGGLCLHSLAELYGTLTRLPSLRPRPTPHEVVELLKRSVLRPLEPVPLDTDDYVDVLGRCADRSLLSGAVFDALIHHAASTWKAQILLTWNDRDFTRLAGKGSPKITHPAQMPPPSDS